MKVKTHLQICTGVILAAAVSCQGEMPEDKPAARSPAEVVQADSVSSVSEEVFGLGLQDDIGNPTSEQNPIPEVIRVLSQLHREAHIEVATCAGFEDEILAIEARKEELKTAGVSREVARETIREEFGDLKPKLDDNRAVFLECKDTLKDSDISANIHSIMAACFLSREDMEARRFPGDEGMNPHPRFGEGAETAALDGGPGDRPRMGKGPKGGLEFGHKGRRLPPKEAANFDSEECQAVMTDYQPVGNDLL